jgi:hypothetical protein
MKLYMVYFCNDYDENILQMVFSSREKAEAYIVKATERRNSQNCYCGKDTFWIDEDYTLDGEYGNE